MSFSLIEPYFKIEQTIPFILKRGERIGGDSFVISYMMRKKYLGNVLKQHKFVFFPTRHSASSKDTRLNSAVWKIMGVETE